ncbi:MAG: alpha-hydroxy-acid oxidizing protein, partial [Actinobacteria bacterium]|nr:alpha-hydroxy-acid oxidizing protein [Actinomycetota bacterium]NIS29559.1 alpha-hydroxy-acid oxidizing protein [Actinomycetota bacterium]NIT94604.1 alpha-hydroxy-acid oxidizing protein [Actinomycetota bacterium]NIU18218.1 alpha-hydroxy-acid oxidizing protein [Actinomycetota bacterium]NIU64902.1 alpha-hydroxy-acid oxidizing protein [Actinomycetota bacterium]
MFDSLRSVLRFRRLERDPDLRRLARVADVADLRTLAKKRLPAGVFDYIDGGAEDEVSLARNEQAYRNLGFRPRILRDVSRIDTSCTVLGRPTPLPLVLAPTGFTRIASPPGELAVARAAARTGVPYVLSTMGTRSIEELAEASDSVEWGGEGGRRLWFQVYTWKDRGLVQEMVERSAAAGFEALVLTVDTARLGRRERDVRRGMELPPKLGLDTIVDGLRRPGWTWSFLRNEPIVFANVATSSSAGAIPDGTSAVDLAGHINSQFDASLSWGEIEWLRSIWAGKIVVKGIQTVADTVLAVEHGVDAACLSNHGGRQLDGAPAPIDLVAPCRDAVGDAIEIIAD